MKQVIKKTDSNICIREINENIRRIFNNQSLTRPLATLNRNCEFKKRYEISFDLRNEEKIKKEVKEKARKYQQKPEVKEKTRKYQQKPEVKERIRKYYQKPEVKEKARKYQQKPEVKEKARKYKQKPEVKERKRKYMRIKLGIKPENYRK